MTFEEGLKTELSALTEISKVYPIVAQQEGQLPYLVYRKAGVTFSKTLDGIIKKTEATYYLTLVANKYSVLTQSYDAVIDLLSNIFNRAIGGNGPVITNINFESLGDKFDIETELFLTEILLKVNH